MSAPFVTQLRTRGSVIQMTAPGAPAVTVRVEVPEVWDVVNIAAAPDEQVLAVKRRVLTALFPGVEEPHEAFVMKLRGFEVLDENASLATGGAVDGSIFLLTHRRRRPVR